MHTLPMSLMALFLNGIVCTEPAWIEKTPDFQNNQFISSLESTCTINKEAGDIKKIATYFEEKILVNATGTLEASIPGTYFELPGEQRRITTREPEGTLTAIYIVASDLDKRAVLDSKSETIAYGGMSGYLRLINLNLSVTKNNPDEFTFTLVNTVKIQKPRLAPVNYFFNLSKNKSMENFKTQLMRVSTEILQNL